MSKKPVREKVMVEVKGTREKVDLVEEVLSAIPNALIYVDPNSLFRFQPDDEHPGNVAAIELIVKQLLEKELLDEKIVWTFDKFERALEILISSEEIHLRIFRSRLNGLPELGLSVPS